MIHNLTCVVCSNRFRHNHRHTLTCSRECRQKRSLENSGRAAWRKELPTGTVGAVSEMMVATDLMKKGYAVFRALSSACFCDLIAIRDGRTYLIEARTGYIYNTAKSSRLHYPRATHGPIDTFGIYAPATDEVHYFDVNHAPIEL